MGFLNRLLGREEPSDYDEDYDESEGYDEEDGNDEDYGDEQDGSEEENEDALDDEDGMPSIYDEDGELKDPDRDKDKEEWQDDGEKGEKKKSLEENKKVSLGKAEGKAGGKLSRLKEKKDAILQSLSPRAEALPCPFCMKRTVHKSYKIWDWVPITVVSMALGSPIYRFYCMNRKCSHSFYKNYAFNCPTPQFQPASASLKRPFSSNS